MTLELRIRIKRLSSDGVREREREVCIISSSIAGRPEIRSIMLSIRDSNDSATRLRADALAFVHEFGRRVVQGRSFSPTPLEFDSRGIKGIKGEEERKKWGLVEGDTDDDPSFCFILETEGEGESKDRARSVQRYKGEGGFVPFEEKGRNTATPAVFNVLCPYIYVYISASNLEGTSNSERRYIYHAASTLLSVKWLLNESL